MERLRKITKLYILIYLVGVLLRPTDTAGCPEKCTCSNKKLPDSDLDGLRVKCVGSPGGKISTFKEINLGDINQAEITHLDLSNNHISSLEASYFVNMTQLRRLDLTHNSMRLIDETVFGEMPKLEDLKLSQNLIAHIYQGSFDRMPSLRMLDISMNPLVCDCNLLWLNPWSANNSVKLQKQPKCESTGTFKGTPIKKLKIGTDLHCESQLQTHLELMPEHDQVLFEGDALAIRCRAPRVAVGAKMDSEDLPPGAHVFWGWSEVILAPNSTENITFLEPIQQFATTIQITENQIADRGLLNSILKIPSVSRNHSGMWNCRLRSEQANFSRSIAVYVISNETEYCPANEMHDNKGHYSWPRTIRGTSVVVPCAGDGPPHVYAAGRCNEAGEWVNLNTSQCPFIKDTTRILDQFAKVDLAFVRVLESAERLRNYTALPGNSTVQLKFKDPIDVSFIAKTVDNYIDYLTREADLGPMVLDIVSQCMHIPASLLQKGQQLDGACNKLVRAAEAAAENTPSMLAKKENLAMEEFKIRPQSFSGKTCVWFKSAVAGGEKERRTLQCNIGNQAQSIGFYDKHFDASIQFPASLFAHLSAASSTSTQKLLVSVFQNSNLFPQNRSHGNYKITSCVIGAKVTSTGNRMRENLTEPIFIILRAQPFHHELSAPKPVWWDPELNGGLGDWSSQGCLFSHMLQGMLVFACTKLGYYGLIQHTKYLNDSPDENSGARFRFSPIAVYVGSVILFVCLWINISTYSVLGKTIQMARKAKHALVNTWFTLSLLIVVFNVGIYQTDNSKICQVFGMLTQYLSLAVLFWMCVSVSNFLKRMKRLEKRSGVLQGDDLPKEDIVGRKPILGIYLVGYGIAVIICGIGGAVNIREYASYSYCFMKSGPALSAVFVPATIVVCFLCLLFICIKCNLRDRDINGHMSEGTQGTENVDLDLLEPTTTTGNHYQSISISTPTTSTQDDQEHSHNTQLNAFVITLILYLVTWLFGGLTVSTPFAERILYEEEVFSVIFAVVATILGGFIVFFYGVARSDIRKQWNMMRCSRARNRFTQQFPGDPKELNGGVVTFRQVAGNSVVNHSISRSNSQSSKSRPNSTNMMMKAAADLNSHTLTRRNESPNGAKMTANMNLVLLHRQQFVHNPVIINEAIHTADVFYNPNQSNVARKFFRKQKRLAKQNNIEIQRRDFGGDGGSSEVGTSMITFPKPPTTKPPTEMSMFSSGSKVNNINIHVDRARVECVKEQRHHNPNILSDSCNEESDADRLVVGAESLRAIAAQRSKMSNRENPSVVANIYTNIAETGTPQHETVTMRADERFKKSINTDEDDDDDNLSSDNDPHYVNQSFDGQYPFKSIKEEERSPDNPEAPSTSKTSTHVPTCLELRTTNDSNLVILSLSSPILAMNTLGLPIVIPQAVPEVKEESSSEAVPEEEYASDLLEMPECDVQLRQNHSKSMDNLSRSFTAQCRETRARSISFNNVSLMSDVLLPPMKTSSSPVLFSPSLCDIDDYHQQASTSYDMDCGTDLIFNPPLSAIARHFTSSPTSESDINYQHSEISIRSHGLYAPQPPDNDLTLTGEDSLTFAYQASEVSDADREYEDDDDDTGADAHDYLLGSQSDLRDERELLDESQSSIDELYQRIKRRGTKNFPRRAEAQGRDEDVSSQGSSVVLSNPND
ncbi:adhesion G protein-coupled receptor A3 [Phlebotomus argentipes]|uniref:adhesion G protein-coupled receptor A3 n=1 Tax=Phlebotomus argentipes TaxID=94469 RepID=UPI0028937512|nr:adhesion G protein-coupled receptor A3 [Phlebotomus argentipes]